MSSVESLQRELTVCRNEISNLRKTLRAMNVQFKTQCADIRKALQPTEQAEPTAPEPEKRGKVYYSPFHAVRAAMMVDQAEHQAIRGFSRYASLVQYSVSSKRIRFLFTAKAKGASPNAQFGAQM